MKPLSEVFQICVFPLDLFVFARTCARTVWSSSRPIGCRWFTSRGESVYWCHGNLGFSWRGLFSCACVAPRRAVKSLRLLLCSYLRAKSVRWPCSLPVMSSVKAYCVSGTVHVLSSVDTNDSRGLAKQPVKSLNLMVGWSTIHL